MKNGRCRLHGGTNTGPPAGNRNAVTHGIYGVGLSMEEKGLWRDIRVGELDDELRLARLQLRRALVARKKGGLRISETRAATDALGRELAETIKKRPDFDQMIDRLLGRIGNLERQRAEIMRGLGVMDGDAEVSEVEQVRDMAVEVVSHGAD